MTDEQEQPMERHYFRKDRIEEMKKKGWVEASGDFSDLAESTMQQERFKQDGDIVLMERPVKSSGE